jgi:monofunctional biosynthetic peptidoglycan transglycosylase
MRRHVLRLLGLWLVCLLALQLYFALRVAGMLLFDPQSTAFQRSEAWRLLVQQHRLLWSQEWVPDNRLGDAIKRAAIASEDTNFSEHNGIEWESIERAWQHNQGAAAKPSKRAKLVGGSTISQQLAKNLWLSGERTFVRKGQEFVMTMMLEGLLGKRRILEIYLNNVEWGEGVFGAQAAARHYFHVDSARLGSDQAARLAVMLPAPKRFEKRPASPYIVGRAATIIARMGMVELP